MLSNDNSLDATSTPASDITVGNTVYTPAEIGTPSASIGFDDTAQCVGIGWDWSRSKRFGVTLDFGLVKQGSPRASLTASGPLLGDPAFAADIQAEELQLEDSLDDLDALPFATIGLSFRF